MVTVEASSCGPPRSVFGLLRHAASRSPVSTSATRNTTRHCPDFERTVVFGSVTMKKMNSWYMGPVIGATLASQGLPVRALRRIENSRNDATYVALMCRRPTRQTITVPRIQMTAIGHSVLPHWMLRSDTVAGARNRTALTPKFDGFQR